jgi:hypothetical protein
MQVEQIKCNGISYSYPARLVAPTIETALSIFRMRFTTEEIFDMFPKNDLDFYAGRRFLDNETVVTRISSALTAAASAEYFKKSSHEINENDISVLEMSILAFVESLSGSEMDKLLVEGLRDCASADHWYTFEKQWD